MAFLELSMTRLVGEYDQVQKKAFTKWVNMHLEKANEKIEDLFKDFQDGTKLLTLLRILTGVNLPREKGKMIVHKKQNVRTALSYLTDDRKIRIIGIPVEEIVAGKPKLTLALVWMLILNFELSMTLQQPIQSSATKDSSTALPPKQVSAREVKKELLEWAQRATEGYEEVSVKDFTRSWKNGMAFCAIIDRHRPYLLDYDDCDISRPLENLEKAFSLAENELNVIRLMDPEDVYVSHPPEEVIVMYVSALKQVFPEMPPPHRRKGPPVAPEDYLTRYDALLNWISSKESCFMKRDFPLLAVEIKTLLDNFRHERVEEKEKEREKEELAAMEQQLVVCQQKMKKDFSLPHFSEVQKAWQKMISSGDNYEIALEEELKRVNELDNLAINLLEECERQANALATVRTRLNVLIRDKEHTEVHVEVGEIQDVLKLISFEVEKIIAQHTQLQTVGHRSANTVREKVVNLMELLKSLFAKLDDCVSTVGKLDVLLGECGRRLKDCERWLVTHGKFAENEAIIQQMKEHQMFKDNHLAQAAEAMERLNSLIIPLDKVEATKEMNSRWQQILKQMDIRLENLGPMSDTVSQFVLTKAPLELWLYEQQDYYNSLPLLETDINELCRQREEFEAERASILSHCQDVECLVKLSQEFGNSKKPVQKLADSYALTVRHQRPSVSSSIFSDDAFEEDMTFEEQSAVMKGQWAWSKEQVETRLQQISDLEDRLKQFNEKYAAFQILVVEGEKLLERERPVGHTAQRLAEQMKTCQDFQARLTEAQASEEIMLSLGRSVIGEHFTNPHSDTISEKLTRFIQEWSDLSLAWQNWYDELYATGLHSQNLSDDLDKFRSILSMVKSLSAEVLPASLAMVAADVELKDVESRYDSEVVCPILSNKSFIDSLEASSIEPANRTEVEELLVEFRSLSATVSIAAAELKQVVINVSGWWPDCVRVRENINEVEIQLAEDKPLAGSLEVIRQQDESIQARFVAVEEFHLKVLRAVKHLTTLSKHSSLVLSSPVTTYCVQMEDRWQKVYDQVEDRRNIVEVGMVRLGVYLESRDLFEKWLSLAEEQLKLWTCVRTWNKIKVLDQTESLKVFKVDVELRYHDLDTCINLGGRYLDSAKSHQSMLLAYHCEVTGSSANVFQEEFFNWEAYASILITEKPFETLKSHLVHSSTYHNGIQVVMDDLYALEKRYKKLKAQVVRREARMVTFRDKRLVFDDSLNDFLLKLEEAEVIVGDSCIGKHSNWSLSEQLQSLETLEASSSQLSLLCDGVQDATKDLALIESVDSDADEEESEDVCIKERNFAFHRYEAIQDLMRQLRRELDCSLAEVQAFQAVYSSFAAWLRDTEQKIQRDDPLKLDLLTLSSGINYLKVVSGDIAAHEPQYTNLHQQIHAALEVVRGPGEKELTEKLTNLETRWMGVQVVNEDMEVIKTTISRLECFLLDFSQLSQVGQSLLQRIKDFSISAITGVELEMKHIDIQMISTDLAAYTTQFQKFSSDFVDLFQTPFDQTKVQSDIAFLQSLIMECNALYDKREKHLELIAGYVHNLETLQDKFESWLQVGERELDSLTLDVGISATQKEQNITRSQELLEDVSEHEPTLKAVETIISDLSSLSSESHSLQLCNKLTTISQRFYSFKFNIHCLPVLFWLHDRSIEFLEMKMCAVLISPLQAQITAVQVYQRNLDDHNETHTALCDLSCSLLNHDQSGNEPLVKLSEIKDQYYALQRLCKLRLELLNGFYPQVMLYNDSIDKWEELLKHWEELVAEMDEPTATLTTLKTQMDEIKSLQHEILIHEPEFQSLLVEAQQLFTGPKEEKLFLQDVMSAIHVSCHSVMNERPGQEELAHQLAQDELKMNSLKEAMLERAALLLAIQERAVKFEALIGGLLPWLKEHQDSIANQLDITDPTCCILQEQLDLCKSLQHKLADRSPHKQKLSRLSLELVACLPPHSVSSDEISNRFDQVEILWTNLSMYLSTSKVNLELAVPLARSYEKEKNRLDFWVKKAVSDIKGYSSLPSDPHAVQHTKQMVDFLKSEYNGLASHLNKCLEEGHELSEQLVTTSVHLLRLQSDIEELQLNWNNVGDLLDSLLRKLADVLIQTLEFQQVAVSLEGWVANMSVNLKQQEPVAARVKLIEQQIKSHKLLMNDIKTNSAMVDQVKASGSFLITSTDSVEKRKIEKQLHALEVHFYSLEKIGKDKMSSLQEALQLASVYECHCVEVASCLKELEQNRVIFMPVPISSQSLTVLLDEFKVFRQSVLSCSSDIVTMSTAQASLLNIEIHSLYVSTCDDSMFMKRPGATEAIQIGAALRQQFEQLKLLSHEKLEELTQSLHAVVTYESSYEQFTEWLSVNMLRISEFVQMPYTSEEIHSKLEKLQILHKEIESQQHLLRELTTTATSMIVNCHDHLSYESAKQNLSDLNQQWDDILTLLDNFEIRLKKGLTLVVKYELKRTQFDCWLCACESSIAHPQYEVVITLQDQLDSVETIQNDIKTHESLLEDVVVCGNHFETFCCDCEITPKNLCYNELFQRFQNLTMKLSKKKANINLEVEHLNSLKYQLSICLEQLCCLKEKLATNDLPFLVPSCLEKQLEDLKVLESQWDCLQSSVGQLIEKSSHYTSCPPMTASNNCLSALLNDVNSTNCTVQELLLYQKSNLQTKLSAVVMFAADKDKFSHWVEGVQESLDLIEEEDVHTDVSKLEKKLHKAKGIQEDVSQHNPVLHKIRDIGCHLMNGASPQDFTVVSNQLAILQSSYEALQTQVTETCQKLSFKLVKAHECNDEYSSLMEVLSAKRSELAQMPSNWSDLEAVKVQLESFKEFETDLADIKTRVLSDQQKFKHVLDVCHISEKPDIGGKIEAIHLAWNGLLSESHSHHRLLEDALLQLGQLHNALAELITWVNDAEVMIDSVSIDGAIVDNIEEQLAVLQNLQLDIVAKEASVKSLNKAGESLMRDCSHGDTFVETQRVINDLNYRWSFLKSKLTDKLCILTTELERARSFSHNLSDIINQLNTIEELLFDELAPHGLPATCQAEIDQHQLVSDKLVPLKSVITFLKKEGEQLTTKKSHTDKEVVLSWIKDVETRVTVLVVENERKQVQLEEAKVNADSFNQHYQYLQSRMASLDEKSTAASPLHTSGEVVKQQLDDHKHLLKELDEVEAEIMKVETIGSAISQSCVQVDGEIIQEMLRELRNRFDDLKAAYLVHLSVLKESLLCLGEFEEAYDELKDWLAHSHHHLKNFDRIIGDAEQLSALLGKHKALQKELGSRTPSFNSVMKEGMELLKSKTKEGKISLKRKLSDLKQEWESVCNLSVTRQQELQEIERKIQEFETHLNPIKSWIIKLLPSLDSTEPVHGDFDTVSELLDLHTSFQNELLSHQKGVDAVTTAGKHLIKLLDDHVYVRPQVDELNQLWKCVNQLAVEKERSLRKALESAVEFNQGVRDIWQWTDEKEADLDLLAPPNADVVALQQQIEEMESFNQDIMSYQPMYEEVLQTGQQIQRMAHHRAVPVLESQLHLFQQKWVNLKGKISARSEALASELLEVQGLQNMLDTLMDWVGQAENEMTIAEATLISDDLETLEKQLAEHEQFQEVMATYQPNMDALEKATRKRHPHSTFTEPNQDLIKKTQYLKKHWKKLWLRSSERHRQLLEARTRQKDIALARSFNFDAWRKKFLQWADQQKLRVAELFRRYDTNHDGRLTRDEFMKGLKASGLSMNQIELEKIADIFDENRNGLIDLSEITAILKGQKARSRGAAAAGRQLSDAEKIDHEIQVQASACHCQSQFKVTCVGEGQYRFGDSQKLRMVRILRSTVMVRVGGGWEPLKEFLEKNDPCRAPGRDFSIVSTQAESSKSVQAMFRSKRQSLSATRNKDADPKNKFVSRTYAHPKDFPVSSRQSQKETVQPLIGKVSRMQYPVTTSQEERKSSSPYLAHVPSVSALAKDSEMSKSEMPQSSFSTKTSNPPGESEAQPFDSTSAQVASSAGLQSSKYKLGRRSSKIPKPSSGSKTPAK